jgi:nitrous-oxide reductase
VRPGSEKIVREPGKVTVYMTAIRSHFTPEIVEVEGGRRGHLPRHQFRTRPGRDARLLGLDLQRQPVARAGQDRDGEVQGRPRRRLLLLLHRVLLGAASGDGRLSGREAEGPGDPGVHRGQPKARTYSKADFDKQYKTNNDTQAVIDSVVKYITVDQLQGLPGRRRDGRGRHRPAQLRQGRQGQDRRGRQAKEDWQQATLWAGQWWQYQVKAADIGLRAKTFLEQNGAKVVAK